PVGLGGAIRLTTSVRAAEHIVFLKPLHVVADKEIEEAVPIEVDPECGRTEAFPPAQSARSRDIDECAPSGIAEEPVLSHARYEDVREAVVVVVADRNAHSVHFDVEARAPSYIRKRSVSIVAIETESGSFAFVSRPIHPIDQKNVLPSVAVVVQERAA